MKKEACKKSTKPRRHTIPPDAQKLTFNVILSRDRIEVDYSGHVTWAARRALERLLACTGDRGAAYACKIHDAPQSESYTIALSVTASTNNCWTCLEFCRMAAELARYLEVPWVSLRLDVSGHKSVWYVGSDRRTLKAQNDLVKSAT